MALIKCPDCGIDVSDAAPACLKCGRPIARSAALSPSAVLTPLQRYREPPKSRNVPGAFVLLTFVCVGLWIYFQTQQADVVEPAAPPAPALAEPATAPQRPIAVMTPSELYSDYASNEVATDQRLAGKIIQVTAPVQSIDKDFTDSAVLRFATGDEFGSMNATMDDSQKDQAAKLSRGQVVTIQCKTVRRILDSPMGKDCVFTDDPVAITPGQTVADTAPLTTAEPPQTSTSEGRSPDSARKVDELLSRMDRIVGDDAADEYAAAIQGAITPNWLHQDNLPRAPCAVHITQLPGGVVVSAVADENCPYDEAGKIAVESAVMRSQPLPYKGFESVFQRNLTMIFRAQ